MLENEQNEDHDNLDEVEQKEEEVNPDLFEEEINKKIESFFSSNNNELLSFEKIDDFLKALDLYEVWNSEEEKDTLWTSLMKYNIDNKVDKDGAIKGMHDLLNQEEENSKDNKEDNLLTRISRMSLKNDGNGTVNKLAVNKYKQKAIDEYDCLDNPTLIQFKKIFLLLNINENNKKNVIPIEKVDEVCKHKFIKIERNDIIKYLSFLTCEDKPLDKIKSLNINMDIFYEIDLLLQEKLVDEDLDKYEDDEEDGEKREDPLEIIGDILIQIESTKDNIVVLRDIKNTVVNLNESICETISKIIQESKDQNQHENISNIESLETIISEKMNKFDDNLLNINKEQKLNIKKVNTLKKSILSIYNYIKTLKEDYKILYEKYNNNQELEVDDEMERLLDENVTLNQDINAKKEEINKLINQRAERDIQINELYDQINEDKNLEDELRKEIKELKASNNKYKEEYEKLMDNVINKIQKKEKEEMNERNKIKEMLEKQLKEEEENKNNENNKNEKNKINIKELNNIDKMNIPLSEKLLKKKTNFR